MVGLACYLIFYRLDPIPAYWIGMVPLAVDGVVAAILGRNRDADASPVSNRLSVAQLSGHAA
ncbi:MAG TPA: hypothetical protein VIT42_09530 [Microlunatus sp.]